VSAVASLSTGASPIQRIPWLWYELVVSRTAAPFWVPSAVLLALLLSGGLAIAAAGGYLIEAATEPRFWLNRAYPALCSLAIGYAPEALQRLIANLQPWIAHPEQELAELRHDLSHDLGHFFWLGAVISAMLVVWFAFVDPADMQLGIGRDTYRHLQLFDLLFYAYFCGSATPLVVWVVWLLTKRLRSVELKPGFILNGGKPALSPFNQLLVVVWMTCVLPMVLIVLIGLVRGILDLGVIVYSVAFLCASLIIVFFPQLQMNDWLRQLQSDELKRLRAQVNETGTVGEAGDLLAVQRALLRHHQPLYQIEQVRTASVTLIDMKFIVQIATSMSAILIANFVLRTVFR
jgi:hypothetical protein